MKAFCLNNISKIALDSIKEPDYIVDNVDKADSILVRSFDMHEYSVNDNVLAIARCGAGVNNIPFNELRDKGIVVFNTPGANANAVKELTICSLFLASRDIIGGAEWIKNNSDDIDISKTAEKIKSKFAGSEVYQKTIAILGLGKIGILVANLCQHLGMKVVGYDPYLTVKGATQLDKHIKYVETINEAVKDADFISIHIPLNDSTKEMINEKVFNSMKNDAVFLNFSRDSLVNEKDLEKAIENGIVKKYITDFANSNVVKLKNTIILPHLGASTNEAEDNCALMAIDEIKDYLENGNITNSVNFPSINAGIKQAKNRMCILHKNVPGMIAKFSTILSEKNVNIINLQNKSKGDYAYTIIDYDEDIDGLSIDNVIKVRII